ncbi:MAG: sulfite exporter TauE/SafE family protein [Candidatus Parvarchaeota archaeon]|nr:sulfite exporter TauE/SafE family protein [Candidatus Parvarchaeota archaeon]MCW1294370.1 sulfite exporter TauE/SafE family protein [Candidatus Parvarchaeum tengchongense]MCW1295261.1 sulfite exporter TauE/SafE family protein [Candidatus Parvarchaeum tengchongense]MCW1299412.1 sulfite exporter TauE/SafE family protein [Candidatus Parvarchaeum tengchongense]MCW1311936.1 sulfite exporter TauE/SafE family protein [Candidatus Parvarchaeum tengchongense]
MLAVLIIVPLFAMFIAFIGNMSGIGGGALLVLFFLYYMGLSSVSAGGLSLITIATSSVVGSYSNIKHGFVSMHLFKILLVMGLLGVFLGSLLSFVVPTDIFKGVFGFIPLSIGTFSLISVLKQRKLKDYVKPGKKLGKDVSFIGLVAGIISGFTGMGIGGITGTYMTAVRKMNPKVIFSTIILAMIITSVFGGLLHLGSIRFPENTLIYIPLLIVGAAVGAFIGASVSGIIKSKNLRLFQSLVIISTGILAIFIYLLV